MPFFTSGPVDACHGGVDLTRLVGQISIAFELGSDDRAVSFLSVKGEDVDILQQILTKSTSGTPGQYILKITGIQYCNAISMVNMCSLVVVKVIISC